MEMLQTRAMVRKRRADVMAYAAILLAAFLIPELLHAPRYIFAVSCAGFLALGLAKWRWSVYGLLAYIPFAGIPALAMYPSKAPLLFKDMFFVIPAYMGFLGSLLSGREKISFENIKGVPLWLLCSFAGVVFIHMFNPYVLGKYNSVFALIGARVWLFYIPLYFLAYHLIDSREALVKLAKVVLFISIIPISVGLIEAALLYSGRGHIVYQFYGDRVASVTQEFSQTNYPGGGFLRRLPSTFHFVTQYYGYIISMLPLAAAMYATRKGHWSLMAVLVTTAGLLSGARRAFLFIPAFWLLFSSLSGRFPSLTRLAAMVGLGILLAFSVIEAHVLDVYGNVFSLMAYYSRTTISDDFVQAARRTPLGRGAGVSTGPARHALPDSVPRWSAEDVSTGIFYSSENFYAKVIYELGLPGLLVVTAIFFSILKTSYARHRLIRHTSLGAFSTAFLLFFIMIIVDSLKAKPLDIDPVNVYFWMFAGLSAKLSSLETRPPE